MLNRVFGFSSLYSGSIEVLNILIWPLNRGERDQMEVFVFGLATHVTRGVKSWPVVGAEWSL